MRARAVLGAAVALTLSIGGVALTTLPVRAATQPWMNTAQTPLERANELLAAMTTAEKLTMMHGGAGCGYAGCVDGNSRLGIPPLRLQDGPGGPGGGLSGVTQLPAPVAGAATWDTALMHQYGEVLGNEEWGKGTNVALGPTVNIIRDPRWGRAFESFGEDPYLAGQVSAADIQGIQSMGPMAQVKHYALYNQETYRNNIADNAVASDRTQREIYLPAFEASVKQGGVASAMCSYAAINGTMACEHGPLQNTALKRDMGFTGFITSDWFATHSTVASANNGLDMEMPGADYYGTALTNAVNSGQVSQAAIDDHARRILTSMFRLGLFDTTQTGNPGVVVTSPAHAAVAKQVAQEGSVLLKNSGPVLPIGSATHSIAVIGDGAGSNAMSGGGGSASVSAPYVVTPYQGIKARAGSGATVTYSQGNLPSNGALPPVPSSALTPPSGGGNGLFAEYHNSTDLSGAVAASRVEPAVDDNWGGNSPLAGVNATNWSVKYTGTLHPTVTGSHQFSVTSDDGSRLFVNGQQVIDNWHDQPSTTRTGSINLTAGQNVSIEVDYYQAAGASNLTLGWAVPGQTAGDQAVAAARAADLALVVVNKFESEGGDLNDIDLASDQNTLVSNVAAANPNTVVVVNSGSAVTMPWAGAVKGIIESWYPGQEYGNALAALLFGDANFSGRLPVSFPQSLSNVPAHTTAQWPGQNGQVQYSEGLNVGYRWYDSQNITPLFPFGFGLSYTSFSYAHLTVGAPDASGNVAVSFDVTNSGSRAGAEVPQVYVGQPAAIGEPPKNLRGFTRVSLNPGQTQNVSLTLDARSFQFWNDGWANGGGTHQIYVGSSSRNIQLTGDVTIVGTRPPIPRTPLPRTGWSASASATFGGDVPANMLDGDAGTRWSTGTPMASDQWVTVDMGSTHPVDQITMDSAGSASDYARGYQVFLSSDGTSWGSAVATGAGSGALVTATFAAQTARYIKVVQTGSNSSWWSIAEFNAYASPTSPNLLPRTGWSASASATFGGDVPANMLDGDAGTRWSTGTPMANGQWVTVDMGTTHPVDQITMDSAGSTSDYAHGYQVFLSSDGVSWGSAVATGTGSGPLVTVTFPAQSARYIKVVQTGSSSSWWSIAEFNAYT